MAVASVPKPIIDIESLEQAVQSLQERIDLLQDTLTQQQRLATLGMVTSVIAHEFNNILTPMISYTRYALSDKSDAQLRDKALNKALAGSEKLAAISQSLLGFSRGDNSTFAPIKQAVTETLSCLSRDLSKDGITLHLDSPDELAVAMNNGQFQQVLMNLIVNARAAMIDKPGGGCHKHLTIRASTIKRGKIAQIEITDTGPGIAPEVLPHIFQPFFSTKPREEVVSQQQDVPKGGTGLGLTISQELIQSAGGALRVTSELGKGTSFFIELPLADAKAGKSPSGK